MGCSHSVDASSASGHFDTSSRNPAEVPDHETLPLQQDQKVATEAESARNHAVSLRRFVALREGNDQRALARVNRARGAADGVRNAASMFDLLRSDSDDDSDCKPALRSWPLAVSHRCDAGCDAAWPEATNDFCATPEQWSPLSSRVAPRSPSSPEEVTSLMRGGGSGGHRVLPRVTSIWNSDGSKARDTRRFHEQTHHPGMRRQYDINVSTTAGEHALHPYYVDDAS